MTDERQLTAQAAGNVFASSLDMIKHRLRSGAFPMLDGKMVPWSKWMEIETVRERERIANIK